MKGFSRLLLGLLLFSFASVGWSHNVKITVNNIVDAGEIHIAIYDSKDAFEQDRGEQGRPAPGIVDGVVVPVGQGSFSHTFDLPSGNYAVGIFHDVNGNNRLDTNLFGVPKEQYGFSNDASGRFGPPSFDDAAISVTKDARYIVNLR